MTHTNTSREVESFGSLAAEVLEIDITSLDNAGTETSVSPSHVDTVLGFAGHLKDGEGDIADMDFGWNETASELHVHNGSSGDAANNLDIGPVRVTWWGRP